jgi:PPOX class probable F420-dependent enzyme
VPFRPSTTDRPGQEAAGSDKPEPLASAKRLLLTTFNRDGAPHATVVRVLADGDRAYFRAPGASGTAKRLRHTDWVQVAPCTVLGVCRTGPTVDATARLLAGAQASRAAERLAPKYPAWRRSLGSLARRVTGRQAGYYELSPDEAAAEPVVPPAVTAHVRRDQAGAAGPAVNTRPVATAQGRDGRGVTMFGVQHR